MSLKFRIHIQLSHFWNNTLNLLPYVLNKLFSFRFTGVTLLPLLTVRVWVLYRRDSSCPKVLALSGCNEIVMTGNCDLLYKLQSLHSNYSSTSKYLTSISPSWQYRNDSAAPVKKWFHLHDVSVILRISTTSELKCNCKKNNTHIFFVQLACTETLIVNQKLSWFLYFPMWIHQ